MSSYGSSEFSQYGPWVPFTEYNTGSKYYGEQVYFDEQGNLYLVGQGPIQQLQTASHTDMNIVGQVNQQLGLENSPSTTYQPINSKPTTASDSLESNKFVQLIQEVLGTNLISGVPNWLLLGGAVLGFLRSK